MPGAPGRRPIVVSWIGGTHISFAFSFFKAAGYPVPELLPHWLRLGDGVESPGKNGPIRTLTDGMEAECIYLLASREYAPFADMVCEWVGRGACAPCRVVETGVENPADYEDVYKGAEAFFHRYWKPQLAGRFVYNITPGTPAMQAIMLYAAQVRYAGGRTVRVAPPGTGPRVIDVRLPFSLSIGAMQSSDVPLAEGETLDEVIRTYAPVRAVNILLLGETGTGKSRFAQRIHLGCGDPAERFRAVNCAALAHGDGSLFRSELFGHKKGSFTGAERDRKGAFEEAEGGTLFLDEVGEIPLERQAMLLRALEERVVEPVGGRPQPLGNVRIIAATNRNLMEEVRAGRFRQDLFYRLAMCPVHLRPVRHLIQAEPERFRQTVESILGGLGAEAPELAGRWRVADNGWRVLMGYAWPGNWRELRHVLLLACVYARSRGLAELDAGNLERRLALVRPLGEMLKEGEAEDFSEPLEAWLERQKAKRVDLALRQAGNNRREASRLLGMDYQKLTYYLKTRGA